jgi:hypothetical protein
MNKINSLTRSHIVSNVVSHEAANHEAANHEAANHEAANHGVSRSDRSSLSASIAPAVHRFRPSFD